MRRMFEPKTEEAKGWETHGRMRSAVICRLLFNNKYTSTMKSETYWDM
jgi:hypothetical protein